MSKEITCKLEGCEEVFTPKVHNQKFCSRECCRLYTNARILAQYHEKKNKVMTGRVCADRNCTTLLSRYNEDEYCSVHQQRLFTQKLEGWGWNVDEDGNIYA